MVNCSKRPRALDYVHNGSKRTKFFWCWIEVEGRPKPSPLKGLHKRRLVPAVLAFDLRVAISKRMRSAAVLPPVHWNMDTDSCISDNVKSRSRIMV